jgi:hypothetical protein
MATLIDKFAPYPKTEADATAQNVYRYLLVSAQVSHLRWQAMDKPYVDSTPSDPKHRVLADAYFAGAELFISHWSTVALLRHVMGLPSAWVDEPEPGTDDIARHLWLGWEDGGGPAEVLWDWLVEAGIDPEEIGVEFEKVAPSIPSESRSNP